MDISRRECWAEREAGECFENIFVEYVILDLEIQVKKSNFR